MVNTFSFVGIAILSWPRISGAGAPMRRCTSSPESSSVFAPHSEKQPRSHLILRLSSWVVHIQPALKEKVAVRIRGLQRRCFDPSSRVAGGGMDSKLNDVRS